MNRNGGEKHKGREYIRGETNDNPHIHETQDGGVDRVSKLLKVLRSVINVEEESRGVGKVRNTKTKV